MDQVVSGDHKAFNELYHRYKDRLYYFFYRMLGNSEDMANDFLQELFLKIIEKPESYQNSYPFKTWLFSVANNMCKNEYRRLSVRNDYQKNSMNESPVCFLSDSAIDHDQVLEKIFSTLDELGEEHRSAFLLRYREGFSMNEIAEILGLPEGTVKSRLYYSRKLLAEKLDYLKEEIEL